MVKCARACVFITFFAIIYILLNSIFNPNAVEGSRKWMEYYRLETNDIDVVFIGSSHFGANLDPFILWDEKGIPSFVLGANAQTPPCAYHYLVEALKYQRPKLVIVDIYGATVGSEFIREGLYIDFNGGLRFSMNKYDCVQKTVGDESQRLNVFLGLPFYHSRINEIDRINFIEFEYDRYLPHMGVSHLNRFRKRSFEYSFEGKDSSAAASLEKMAKGKMIKEYLDKMMDLASHADIPILFVSIPFSMSSDRRIVMNAAGEYVRSKGYAYLDDEKIYREAKIDSQTDFADLGHVNRLGTRKLSLFFGEVLDGRYGLSDKRKEPEYASWNEMARWSVKLNDWDKFGNLSTDVMDYPSLKRKNVVISTQNDDVWENGVNRKEPGKIVFKFTWENYFLLDHATSLIIEDRKALVKKVENIRNTQLVVTLESPVKTKRTGRNIFVELNF